MFYVYLLHSIADDGFYIGYTTDLRRRLVEHKQGAYADQRDAQGRERYLKSGAGRRFLRHQMRYYLERFPSRSKHLRPQSHVRRKPFYVATPLGFEPRITPPKGAVLPLHHGVCGFTNLDWRFSIQAQRPKFDPDLGLRGATRYDNRG